MTQFNCPVFRLSRLLFVLNLPLISGCFSFANFEVFAVGPGNLGNGTDCLVLGASDTFGTTSTCTNGGQDQECWISLELSQPGIVQMSNADIVILEGNSGTLVSRVQGIGLGSVEVFYGDAESISVSYGHINVEESCP